MGVIERLMQLASWSTGPLVVENTGEAIEADGGRTVTGYSGPPPRRGQKIVVKNTGNATASGPGSRANSGIDIT